MPTPTQYAAIAGAALAVFYALFALVAWSNMRLNELQKRAFDRLEHIELAQRDLALFRIQIADWTARQRHMTPGSRALADRADRLCDAADAAAAELDAVSGSWRARGVRSIGIARSAWAVAPMLGLATPSRADRLELIPHEASEGVRKASKTYEALSTELSHVRQEMDRKLADQDRLTQNQLLVGIYKELQRLNKAEHGEHDGATLDDGLLAAMFRPNPFRRDT